MTHCGIPGVHVHTPCLRAWTCMFQAQGTHAQTVHIPASVPHACAAVKAPSLTGNHLIPTKLYAGEHLRSRVAAKVCAQLCDVTGHAALRSWQTLRRSTSCLCSALCLSCLQVSICCQCTFRLQVRASPTDYALGWRSVHGILDLAAAVDQQL
jgi:hypothetical protein